MKTGICNTAYFDDEKGEVNYARLREHGFECGDYQQLSGINSRLYMLSEAEFEKTLSAEREEAAKNGINFSQVHAPFLPMGDLPDERARLAEHTKKAVCGARILGSRYIVVHTLHPYNWDEEGDQEVSYRVNREYFEDICEFADKNDVCICAENLPFVKRRLSHTPELVKFVDELNLPNLFICLDTGHANICGENIKDTILLCANRLKTLHIHDNKGNGDLHMLPYCGNIDWSGFSEGIKEIGFDGCLSLEAEVRRNCPEQFRKRMMSCLADMLKSMGEGEKNTNEFY